MLRGFCGNLQRHTERWAGLTRGWSLICGRGIAVVVLSSYAAIVVPVFSEINNSEHEWLYCLSNQLMNMGEALHSL